MGNDNDDLIILSFVIRVRVYKKGGRCRMNIHQCGNKKGKGAGIRENNRSIANEPPTNLTPNG